MLPVSDDFLEAVRSSHAIVSRVRVITPGATGADPPGVDLLVIDGSVTLDGVADVRGSLDLTVAEAWPAGTSTADLVPYGTELVVSRGVVFGNGVIERAPLGIYRITSGPEQDNAPDGPLRISAQDRMSGLIEARLIAPRQFTAATSLGTVVTTLVTEVYPEAVIEWDDATSVEALGRPQIVEEDRYGFLAELVKAQGKVFYYDYRGVLVIRTPPDPVAAVWDVDGGEAGVLVTAGRALTREGMCNAVVATGEAVDSQTPAYGVAYDLDPASVTYWYGSFGKVPEFFSSPLLTTNAKAAAAARTILTQRLGRPYTVDFSTVPNPALEPLDAVRITYPPRPGGAPASETHVLEQLRIPLAPEGALTASTRHQTLAST